MSNNPLEDDAARDQRIRELAYQLWEADGSPHGSDLEYWERARELVAMEDSRGSGQLPIPSEDDPHQIDGEVIDEASLQDNLGEFPNRLSDQGDRQQTPSARKLKA